MDGLLSGVAVGVLSGVILGAVAVITVLACKHPKSYEKLFGGLLIILLGALAGGTFWDLSHGAGYSRIIVMGYCLCFVLARCSSLVSQGQVGKGQDRQIAYTRRRYVCAEPSRFSGTLCLRDL